METETAVEVREWRRSLPFLRLLVSKGGGRRSLMGKKMTYVTHPVRNDILKTIGADDMIKNERDGSGFHYKRLKAGDWDGTVV